MRGTADRPVPGHCPPPFEKTRTPCPSRSFSWSEFRPRSCSSPWAPWRPPPVKGTAGIPSPSRCVARGA